MNADDRVPVTLTAAQWNAVLAMLAEQPYRQSFPLIQAIQQQCNQFDVRSASPVAVEQRGRGEHMPATRVDS